MGEGNSNGGSGVDGGGGGDVAQTNDATWANRFHPSTAWTSAGGTFSATISATTQVGSVGSYNWSSAQMTADIQAWVNNSTTNFGWVIKTDETGSRNTKKFASRNNPTSAETPSLSVTYTAATPVTLAFIKAAEVKQGVLVSWQTQTEFNNAFFLVEHSTNGTSFSSIGKVNGAGSSNNVNNYKFIHQGVIQGNHYYRLAQTDINGQISYSSIVQVPVRSKHKELVISPNPVTDIISLRGFKVDDKAVYTILNASGAKVLTGKLASLQINVNHLPSGYYTISLNNGEEAFYGKFLKK